MDAVSLGLSVLTTFKELYLISKFIHRTFSSVKHSKTERENLEEDFLHELLYLQSFGQIIIMNDGLLMNGNLNSVRQNNRSYEDLTTDNSDYAKVAAVQDDEYRTYSPYLHSSIANSKVIEFALDLNPNMTSRTPPGRERRKYGFGWLLSSRPTANWDSWMWALFERRKFERFLCEFRAAALGPQPDSERVLVEFKTYTGETDTVEAAPDPVTKERVNQLACLLSSAGHDGLHTLSLRGLIYQPAQSRYAFLFDFPVGAHDCDPISLWTLIESPGRRSRLTLPQRFQVARYVATALSAFHVDGWVHKAISSQSIVFFHDVREPSARLSTDCYLVDFEFARPESAETQHTFDDVLERNLYRHPDRQGTPTISFQKHHDIYSLGVVLLEIGLWVTASDIYRNATARLRNGAIMNPRGIRNLYIDIANRKLPHHMGPAYHDAVVKCLSGDFTETDTNLTMEFYEGVVQSIDVLKLE
ncbi:uncharacterized protein N7511_008287 [Penicillium nucicola]|uniref:uncharacterized protein n=1 Tax=Penicillium nucicola TaxID=1850975 RepID=UPI002545346C|nr:uncharacterized protein N7511_008287 [Penicillium nucicola]KAJ5754134.1 hypothetical protein N7511_008287 [Penicillium nucicola]